MSPPSGSADTPTTLKHVDFLILAVLVDGPLHGYGIVRAIDQVTDGRVRLRPGDVYRVLYRMHRRGLLEPAEPVDAEPAEGERRSYYAISDLGHRLVREEAELLTGVARRLLARAGGGGRG